MKTLIAGLLLPVCFSGCSKSPQPTHEHNLQELHRFWDIQLQDLLAVQLLNAKLPYPEINERYQDSARTIFEHTHKPLAVNLSSIYHWAAPQVEASAGSGDDANVIYYYIPAIEDGFDEFQQSGYPDWHQAFIGRVIIVTMHELEHARYNTTKATKISMEEEARAWAETCRYTIEPLVEKYHFPLIGSEAKIYRAWKTISGKTDNPLWYSTISNLYGPLDGKTEAR